MIGSPQESQLLDSGLLNSSYSISSTSNFLALDVRPSGGNTSAAASVGETVWVTDVGHRQHHFCLANLVWDYITGCGNTVAASVLAGPFQVLRSSATVADVVQGLQPVGGDD